MRSHHPSRLQLYGPNLGEDSDDSEEDVAPQSIAADIFEEQEKSLMPATHPEDSLIVEELTQALQPSKSFVCLI
jgi:hypothetical protein